MVNHKTFNMKSQDPERVQIAIDCFFEENQVNLHFMNIWSVGSYTFATIVYSDVEIYG